MTGINRRSACPSLAAPMQTGDGLLVRLVFDEPEVAIEPLIAVLDAAKRHGSGMVELTRRGNLQIRGLTSHSAGALASEIDAVPLAHGGLPITVGGLAGIDADEIADPLMLSRAIRRSLDPALQARLAPKISVVIDGGGLSDLGALIGDVRLTAIGFREKPQWHVAVGGNSDSARPVGIANPSDAAAVVVRLLERIADRGRDVRGRDLSPDDWHNLPLLDPGNELCKRQTHGCFGTFPTTNAALALCVGMAFGACHADEMIGLLQQAAALGIRVVRLAPGRALLFPGLTADIVEKLQHSANASGFVTDRNDPRASISACAGLPGCASGHIETRTLARALIDSAPSLIDGSFTLHISGCAKRCADIAGPRLTIIGTAQGCDLVLESSSDSLPAASMTVDRLKTLVGDIDRDYGDQPARSEPGIEFLRRRISAEPVMDQSQ